MPGLEEILYVVVGLFTGVVSTVVVRRFVAASQCRIAAEESVGS